MPHIAVHGVAIHQNGGVAAVEHIAVFIKAQHGVAGIALLQTISRGVSSAPAMTVPPTAMLENTASAPSSASTLFSSYA